MILKELVICYEGDLPDIFGVPPLVFEVPISGRSSFIDLSWSVPFDGGLLLGADFIQELYVHMGFHPPWKYRTVMELIFKDGSLRTAQDRSASMERIREHMLKRPPEPSAPDDQHIQDWIRRSFSLDYRRWDI